MSGHSKWHTIKHKKGAADAKRGKVFTRVIKELTVAARNGGGDPDMNPRLRTIIAEAKQHNMPADNIKRAIRRGTGEEEGVTYDEVMYEGYGPGGVAILVETLTDNKNRTVSRFAIFGKWGGNLAEPTRSPGCSTKGLVTVEKGKDEDTLMAAVLDAGADDMTDDGSAWEIVSPPDAHVAVTEAVRSSASIPPARRSRCCRRTTSSSKAARRSRC
jgi:YebC/PmpR family DNA-binding regulatory protein